MTFLSKLALKKAVLAAALVVTLPASAFAERVALIIGNSAYQNTTALKNPRNDATAIASKLRGLGFTTVEGYDLTTNEMGLKIRDFARSSRGAELSVVFYAGHGISVNGENFLVPVDATLADETSLTWELIPLSTITNQFDYNDGASLVFLDACRDNPLAGKLAAATGNRTRSSATGGLAAVDLATNGTGAGIAFATSPGNVAQDGQGNHSPFTEALLSHLGTANATVASVMNKVTGDVVETTHGAQRPWFNASFTEDVHFNLVQTAQVVNPQPTPVQPVQLVQQQPSATPSPETTFWEFAQQSNTIESYQLYIDQFPNGQFVPIARFQQEQLRKEAVQPQIQPQNQQNQQMAQVVPQQQFQTRAIMPNHNMPLILSPSPYMRAQPATQQTEALLQLGDRKHRENNKLIQARLTAAGYNVGTIDGLIGGGTRGKIKAWQTANGLPPTGYFNALQLQLLYAQTEDTYAAVLASAPTHVSSGSSSSRKTTNNTGKIVEQAVGSFFQGLGEGLGSR